MKKKVKKVVVIPMSEDLKRKLDAKRDEGFTINGFVRSVLEKALADTPAPRKGKNAA